jgi:uncharacterized protein involved in exopolysaccharide biosynthesis
MERAQREVALRQSEARQRQAGARPTRAETRFVVNLRAQAEAAGREVDSLLSQRREVQAKITRLETLLEQSPAVERDYRDLLREHENATARYREVTYKQMTARVAESLEKDSKGERFTLIDPPQLPERPLSPNRPLILLVGLCLAVIGGIGWAVLREALDRSVHGVADLVRHAGAPLLGVLPELVTPEQRRRRVRLRWLTVTGLLVALVAGLTLLHLFYMPLPDLVLLAMARLRLN